MAAPLAAVFARFGRARSRHTIILSSEGTEREPDYNWRGRSQKDGEAYFAHGGFPPDFGPSGANLCKGDIRPVQPPAPSANGAASAGDPLLMDATPILIALKDYNVAWMRHPRGGSSAMSSASHRPWNAGRIADRPLSRSISGAYVPGCSWRVASVTLQCSTWL